jgi:hypothetical protein
LYQRTIDHVPRGHTAGLAVTGDGLELLADLLRGLPRHDYLSLAASEYQDAEPIAALLQLDPARLSNPDLDIRYVLPDLLIERSAGRLTDDGYDYAGEGSAPCLLLFLRTDDVSAAIPGVIEVLKSERVLENDLSCIPVAVEEGDQFRVVHPPGFEGSFRRPGGR